MSQRRTPSRDRWWQEGSWPRAALAWAVIVAGPFALMVVAPVRSGTSWGVIGGAVAWILLAWLATHWEHRSIRRRTRYVHDKHGRVCFECGFDLEGLDDRGTCPECGRAYDVERNLRRFQPRYRWTLAWPWGRNK